MNTSDTKEAFTTGSQRDSRDGKGRYDLISPIALKRLALRMEGGATHYGERNWEKGQPLMRYVDSAIRHIQNHVEGKRDEDHMGAALWNIHSFIHTEEMIKRGSLPETLNDLPRFTREAYPEVVQENSRSGPDTGDALHCPCGNNSWKLRVGCLPVCVICGSCTL